MTAKRLAIAIWAASLLVAAIAVALLVASWNAPVPNSWGFRGFTTTFAIGFASLGLRITLARGNFVGWVLLTVGLMSGLQDLAEEYAIYGVLQSPGSLPRPDLAGWFESWIWVTTVIGVAVFLPLLFPSGRLPSRRWWTLVVATATVALLLMAGLALNEGPLNNAPFVVNPFGMRGLHVIDVTGLSNDAGLENSAPFFLLYLALFASAVAAVASLFARYRSAGGIERQQLKWFAAGAAFAAAGMVVGGTFQQYKAAQVLFILAIQFVPMSVAIAILRFRLYDIDVVINRALVYGATLGLLAATFVAVVVLLQAALRPLTGGSEIAVALSTMLTVAALQPIRIRVQRAVDRRFYRSRYDAALTLDAFASRLRDEVDLDAVRTDLLAAIDDAIRPSHASVWLRATDR